MSDFIHRLRQADGDWAMLMTSEVPIIYVGTASCGRAAGALDVLASVKETLKEFDLKAKVIQVGCIGPCYLEPLMDIAMPGEPRITYGNVSANGARRIIKSHMIDGVPPKRFAVGHFGDGDEECVGDLPRFFDLPMLKPQVRIVLKNCGIIDPENIGHYLANDGYLGLRAALGKIPENVIAEVEEAGLRGRGGAGFTTAQKWKFCRNTKSDTKYMICNADEGDPGAFMNRSLIEGDPHAVLEGLLIAAYAIGASHGYVYIRAEYPLAVERLKKAVEQMRHNRLLGRNIMNSGFDFDITIKEGAGAFVCGEETALISSIEGERGMPRSRPPYPAVSGLYGKPTVINNVETLGTLPAIMRKGAKWYAKHGTEKSKGTKTFSLVGKVARTGLIEVPMGTSLREIIFDIGGGPLKEFKAVQTGGPSGGCLPEKFLDMPVEYESLASVGSIMGSGGLIVMDEDTCVVDVAKYFLGFTQAESCGKCNPCRIGTRQMAEILDAISRGEATEEDLDRLESLGRTIRNTSLCGLGQTAPNPVLTTLRYFRDEYLAHVNEKRCDAIVCNELVQFRILQDVCTGCLRCVRVCPTGAITGKKREPAVLDPTKCVKCRSCVEACEFDAVAGDGLLVASQTGGTNE
jgi:NADH:ubiquinone oxidoreductase subunit F (NADH-binding)/NAD-dependent dihydropyrimidine dehydrogenase PreA subunit/(2Fe-2S) ferredoxin